MTPEGKVKKAIKEKLIDWGFWQAGGPRPEVVRGWFYMPVNNGMGVSGIPDFVGALKKGSGRFFSIEAKAPKKEPNPRQLDRHEEIESTSALVFVMDDVGDMEALRPYV